MESRWGWNRGGEGANELEDSVSNTINAGNPNHDSSSDDDEDLNDSPGGRSFVGGQMFSIEI